MRLLLLIVASSFIIISMMVVIGVVSCILLCFEDTLHDEEQLVEHILQVILVKSWPLVSELRKVFLRLLSELTCCSFSRRAAADLQRDESAN